MGLSREQALDCLRSNDLIGIGMEADAVRRRLHPEGVVSYALGGNVCCTQAGAATDAQVEKICETIRQIVEIGGSAVRLSGLSSVDATTGGLGEIERLLRTVRQRFPAIWLEGMSVPQVAAIARASGIGVQEAIARLQAAGLNSIGSDGLVARDASVKAGAGLSEWLEVHRAAHGAGMRTTAALTLGACQDAARAMLADLLVAIRRLQEETGGFMAFAPRSFQPKGGGTGYGEGEPTAVEFVKTLAVSRTMLDNVGHVEAGGAGRGLKVLQTALRFGANDAGWLVAQTGKDGPGGCGEEDLRRVIGDAGFKPVQRDAPYRTMFLN
jgi:cyclic dehypoxanthinyl futalosine synthase